MAVLKCRHCAGEISSGSRQVQCPHCAALFPFACAKCGCNLRSPFAVYEDERYLSLDNKPLCAEHFMRLCPDCSTWFNAEDNPGFFRCACCTEEHAKNSVSPWDTDNLGIDEEWADADTGQTAVMAAAPVSTTPKTEVSLPILMVLMNLLNRLLRHNSSNTS